MIFADVPTHFKIRNLRDISNFRIVCSGVNRPESIARHVFPWETYDLMQDRIGSSPQVRSMKRKGRPHCANGCI